MGGGDDSNPKYQIIPEKREVAMKPLVDNDDSLLCERPCSEQLLQRGFRKFWNGSSNPSLRTDLIFHRNLSELLGVD